MSGEKQLDGKVDNKDKLNDLSDIDMGKLQYTSSILEQMKKDGIYDDLIKTISALAFADKSKSFIVKIIREKYPTYCGGLTAITFNKWLEYYKEVASAYAFNRNVCLGELVYMGMKKAKKSIDNPRDDFIVKLMDRIDDGTLSYKNKAEIVESKASCSNQTINTINRIFTESGRFNGLDNIEIDDSDIETGDDNED